MPCSAWMIKPAVVKSNKGGRDEDEEDDEGSDAKADDGCLLKLKYDEFFMEFDRSDLLPPETNLYLHLGSNNILAY